VQEIRKLLGRSFGASRGVDAMLLIARRPALLSSRPDHMAQALSRLATLLRLPTHKLAATVLQ